MNTVAVKLVSQTTGQVNESIDLTYNTPQEILELFGVAGNAPGEESKQATGLGEATLMADLVS
jgi:hypothetical protein